MLYAFKKDVEFVLNETMGEKETFEQDVLLAFKRLHTLWFKSGGRNLITRWENRFGSFHGKLVIESLPNRKKQENVLSK